MKNFHIFLGMFVVSFVSGNPTEQVSSCPGESVLLPFSCEDRNPSKSLMWQMKNISNDIVLVFEQREQILADAFKGRVEFFYRDDPDNCSILLKNVTYNHHGTYTCYYWTETFQNPSVNLHVYGATNASQPTNCSSPTNSSRSSPPDKEMNWLIAIPAVLGILLLFLFLYRKIQGRANVRQRGKIDSSVL